MPQTDESRTEFGFTRTECACVECTMNCRFVPGYLVPADVERISRHLGYNNVFKFALENLAASPGATVMSAEDGRIFQIPTLVPQRKPDGSCKFLQNNSCTIHAVSPYGCALFDAHQSSAEANRRSSRGLQEVAREWAARGKSVYVILWRLLYAGGLRAVPPQVARQRMKEAEGNTQRLAGEVKADDVANRKGNEPRLCVT